MHSKHPCLFWRRRTSCSPASFGTRSYLFHYKFEPSTRSRKPCIPSGDAKTSIRNVDARTQTLMRRRLGKDPGGLRGRSSRLNPSGHQPGSTGPPHLHRISVFPPENSGASWKGGPARKGRRQGKRAGRCLDEDSRCAREI